MLLAGRALRPLRTATLAGSPAEPRRRASPHGELLPQNQTLVKGKRHEFHLYTLPGHIKELSSSFPDISNYNNTLFMDLKHYEKF